MNESDPLYSYKLLRNNVTEIVYEKGGFFKRHQDYLSLVSNVVEEFTMIVCINAAGAITSGGETVVHLSASASHASKATTQRGSALVFRKDLPHEGRVVEDGEKRIVTLNLWATRKQSDGRIIHVTFTPSAAASAAPAASAVSKAATVVDNMATLRALVNQPQSYALSVSTVMAFPDSLLARKVTFEDAGTRSTGGARSAIIPFVCENASYEEFAVVYEAYQRCRLTPERVSRHLPLLRFFGLGDEHMLIDLAGPATPNKPSAVLQQAGLASPELQRNNSGLSDSGGDSTIEPVSSSLDRTVSSVSKEISTAVGDVLICASHEHARVVSAMARALELPYVPFRVWFAEGKNAYGGEMEGEPDMKFAMLPVWFSVGDYDNIVGFRRLMHKSRIDPSKSLCQGAFEEHNPFKPVQIAKLQTPGAILHPKADDELIDAGAPDELIYDYYDAHGNVDFVVPIGLRFAYTSSLSECIHVSLFDGDYGSSARVLSGDVVVLPGGADCKQPASNGAPYHYDSAGNACFTAEESRAAAELLHRSDVIERAKAAIKTTRFVLPQLSEQSEHHFCNEEVYTSSSILCVSGVVRMAA